MEEKIGHLFDTPTVDMGNKPINQQHTFWLNKERVLQIRRERVEKKVKEAEEKQRREV